jgi:hypothetical protein
MLATAPAAATVAAHTAVTSHDRTTRVPPFLSIDCVVTIGQLLSQPQCRLRA